MIHNGRLDRRDAIKAGLHAAAGIASVSLGIFPEFLASAPKPVSDRFSAEYVSATCLKMLDENLPRIHRNYAGFGADADTLHIDGLDYHLEQRYLMFAINDEDPAPTLDEFNILYLAPSALTMAKQFTNQVGLAHLVSRRIDPAPGNTGVVSHFSFHDAMGLRATIAYTIGDPKNPKPRTVYAIDMLIGVMDQYDSGRNVA